MHGGFRLDSAAPTGTNSVEPDLRKSKGISSFLRLPTGNPCGRIFGHEAVPIQFREFRGGWRGCAGWGFVLTIFPLSP